MGFIDFTDLPKENQQLYNAVIENKVPRAQSISQTLETE